MYTIPEGSVEIQTGLWWHQYTQVIAGREYLFSDIYSAEGYCFWEVNQPENYDEEGNLLPEGQRVYAQFASLAIYYDTAEKINADFISVPVQPGYEIVNKPDDTVTA